MTRNDYRNVKKNEGIRETIKCSILGALIGVVSVSLFIMAVIRYSWGCEMYTLFFSSSQVIQPL